MHDKTLELIRAYHARFYPDQQDMNPDPAGKAIKPPGFVPASARVHEIVERAA